MNGLNIFHEGESKLTAEISSVMPTRLAVVETALNRLVNATAAVSTSESNGGKTASTATEVGQASPLGVAMPETSAPIVTPGLTTTTPNSAEALTPKTDQSSSAANLDISVIRQAIEGIHDGNA